MKKRTDADNNTRRRNESLEEEVYDAMIERGWIIPQTEEDVLRAEQALAQVECSPLPPQLADPYRIIDRLDEVADEDVILKALRTDERPGAETSPAASQVRAANAETANAKVAHVSVLAELRERTKMPASQIALRMNVPVPFLSAVGRYPKAVPIGWRRELASRAEQNLGVEGGVVMNAFEHPYQAQMAASRDTAYETEEVTTEDILTQSGMDEEAKRYWMSLAAEG